MYYPDSFKLKKGLDKVTHWHDFYLRLEKVIRDGEVKTRGTIFNK
jgi:hypothetical protein